jgi:hypothetical protein
MPRAVVASVNHIDIKSSSAEDDRTDELAIELLQLL